MACVLDNDEVQVQKSNWGELFTLNAGWKWEGGATCIASAAN